MARIDMPKLDNSVDDSTANGFNSGFAAMQRRLNSQSTPIADQGFQKPKLGDAAGFGASSQGYQPGMLGAQGATAPQVPKYGLTNKFGGG